ncbi:hypothetical protein ACCO45_009020 [Purpureocillium lilacinum]|uniref:Uncharacterized protein n=1 Tax=Purpureocillium lilacinum TaxID=33203 RepID=A0ACC4DKU6_PURLI
MYEPRPVHTHVEEQATCTSGYVALPPPTFEAGSLTAVLRGGGAVCRQQLADRFQAVGRVQALAAPWDRAVLRCERLDSRGDSPGLVPYSNTFGGLHCAPASMPGSGLARARPLLCFRTFLAGASPPWFEHVPAGQAVESTHQSPAVSVVPLLRDRRLAGHARGVSARP